MKRSRFIPSAGVLLFVLHLAMLAHGFEPHPDGEFQAVDVVTYFGTTDQEIKVSWDHNDPVPDYYEITLYHVERGIESPAGIGKTDENRIVFKLPRSGHFIARVRACLESSEHVEGCETPPCCSEWSESIDPEVASVDGQPRAWWIYGHVAGPGDIVINSDP